MAIEDVIREFISHPNIMIVEKDQNFRVLDCNAGWLKAAGFKHREAAIGATDDDCAWKEFNNITQQYESDILSGEAYDLINPAAVEEGRYCWFHNYKWPKRNATGQIIGLNVVAYEIKNLLQRKNLFHLTHHTKFGMSHFSFDKPVKDGLTSREKEVLFYLCYGLSSKSIGKILAISYRTVELHIQHIKTKFNCKTKSQVIEYAVLQGYILILPGHFIMKDFSELE